jgi:predicted ABC-type ATPase
MPLLYIITGSNGAGKSSVGPDYIPTPLRSSVFDGDKLFMQKRSEFWTNGVRSHKECKKLAAEVVETTFDALVESALNNNSDV